MTKMMELVCRAKTLHRRFWPNKQTSASRVGVFDDDVNIGPVSIRRAAGCWTVILKEDDKETIVYYEHISDDCSVEEGSLEKALKHLRHAMILDDLARL